MALNPEIAEVTRPRVEATDSGAANLAAQSWNQNDMRNLNASAIRTDVPADFGTFELFDEHKPILIAKVDAILDSKTGTLTVTEQTGNDKFKKGVSVDAHVWSGNGPYGIGYEGATGADGHCDNVKGHGPIPKGNYLIGDSYEEPKVHEAHPGGDSTWYRLYGADGKGGFSHQVIWNGRGVFALHTGLRSDGCVTVPSEVGEDDPAYPHSKKFDKVKDVLDSTKPAEYKGSTFRGWLHVK